MNIRDLEEFEGLTPDMIRAYLERTGWKRKDKSGAHGSAQWYHADLGGHEGHLFDGAFESSWLEQLLRGLELQEERPIQAILRDINPRMAHIDDPEVFNAHPGLWVCVTEPGDRPNILPAGHAFIQSHVNEASRFWPCDAAGNKVKWPTVTK